MSAPGQENHARGVPERVFSFAALLGGIALFGLMLVVSVSVFFRYALNQPLLGSQEIVEVGMVFVVMLAMPHTAITGQHIRVDILDEKLGRLGRFVCDLLARCIGIVVLGLLVRKSFDKTLDAIEFEDVTNMIELPLWWAYAAITVGMALYALVLLLQMIRQLGQGASTYE